MIMDKNKKSGGITIVIAIFFSYFIYLYLGNYKRFSLWLGIFLLIALIGTIEVLFFDSVIIFFLGGFLGLGVWISSIREAFSFAKS